MTEQEAQADALTDFIESWYDRNVDPDYPWTARDLAEAIEEWQASRKVVALHYPSIKEGIERLKALEDIRAEVADVRADIERIASQPVQVEVTEANRVLIAEVMQEDTGDRTVSWWRRRARRLAAALGGGGDE